MASYVRRYLRVYLLDDHDLVRKGLADLLMPATDIDVVGSSSSARDAVQAILDLEVDVMVLDLRLQDGTGVEVCRAVRSVDPSISGLLLTSSDDDEALVAAMLAGAAGYVIKLARNADIISAIRRVGAGKSLIDPAAGQRVTRELLTSQLRPPMVDAEREILSHVLGGLTDTEVAEQMGLSLESAAPEIAGLVARILRPGIAEGSTPPPIPQGKHRRPDSEQDT
ncbi:MAG TPA: response regulator transcription factor [Nocardioides sp.]|nr:response regulator transcription factor [Nocardioides sp.]